MDYRAVRRLELIRGGEVIGKIHRDASLCDFPWYGGWFEPSPNYTDISPLFEELRASTTDDRDLDERAADALEAVMEPGISIRDPETGESVEVLGILIDGDNAYWR
jgi:hypothetical protein